MTIRNPNEILGQEKKIRMLIAGYPGIGKSTLALSAPRPLHIDADFGIDRIEPRYRVPFIQPQSYQELLDDLVPDNLDDFDTLVFDTGGQLFADVVMANQARQKEWEAGWKPVLGRIWSCRARVHKAHGLLFLRTEKAHCCSISCHRRAVRRRNSSKN